MATRRKTGLPFPNCGKNIKKYRKLAGYSISKFAEEIEISSNYLSSLESCYQMPSIYTLYKTANALHVTIERLLTNNPDQTNDSTIKKVIIETLNTLNNEELEFLYGFICDFTQLLCKH